MSPLFIVHLSLWTKFLKLTVNLTCCLIFKELVAINQSMRSKWCIKMQFKEVFSLRYSLKFSFGVWWMLRLPGRATKRSEELCTAVCCIFIVSAGSEVPLAKEGLAVIICDKWCDRKLWGSCGLLKSYENLTTFYLAFYPHDWTKFQSCLQ